jgi:hypothetical protein
MNCHHSIQAIQSLFFSILPRFFLSPVDSSVFQAFHCRRQTVLVLSCLDDKIGQTPFK